MKTPRILTALTIALVIMCPTLEAQQPCSDQGSWNNNLSFPYSDGAIDVPLLLTDGRVMVQYVGTNSSGYRWQDWYALTPDNTGSYTNGSWTELASLHNIWGGNYGPFAFASDVLSDGRVIVQGGEWNDGASDVDVNMGAIYTPAVNGPGSWSELQPPQYMGNPWPAIGDAQSVVLPNKTYMVAACGTGKACSSTIIHWSTQQALLNPSTLNWTVLANDGKNDGNGEEGYTLLPGINGNVLTIDTGAGSPVYELFNTSTNTWTNNSMPVQLYGNFPSGGEIGPAIVTPDGNVFAAGAASVREGHNGMLEPGNTGIYNPSSDTWTVGPSFPYLNPNQPLGLGDEMAALLPDGNVLVAAHSTPYTGTPGSYDFLEWQYQNQTFCSISGAASTLTQNVGTSRIKLLVLPTGQVFVTSTAVTDGNPSAAYYIYTPPTPTNINPNWQPSITSVPSSLTRGTTYQIFGLRFNGLSQASMYGDDFQNATNYPLIQITNNATGHVFYAKTHDHNTMAISTGVSPTFTSFEVSQATETGASTLVVIANGIASSNSAQVTIQ